MRVHWGWVVLGAAAGYWVLPKVIGRVSGAGAKR